MNRLGPGLATAAVATTALAVLAGPLTHADAAPASSDAASASASAASSSAAQPRSIGVGESYLTDDGVRIALRGTDTGTDIGAREVRLVVSDDSTRVRAWVPAGSPPVALTRIVAFRSGDPGYVVEQEGGDFAAWHVFVVDPDAAGRLTIAEPVGKRSPGSGFTQFEGEFAYQTSRVVGGVLRTRIESGDRSQVLALYRWNLDSSGEQLVKHRIG